MIEERYEKKLENLVHEALISCEKCHFCNTVCPIVDFQVTQGPYGINRSIYYALKWNELNQTLRDLVYSCTTCGKCVEMCKNVSRALPLVEIIEKAREYMLVEKMMEPMPSQSGVLKNMYVRGNPWGSPSHERTKWAKGCDVRFATEETNVATLFFVGCAASYDPQAQKIARNLSTILQKAGVNFGVLENESCSGHEAKRMGESGLFDYLADANVQLFRNFGIDHVVTVDPHSFYSFTREYPNSCDSIKFQHYTQFLNELIDEGKLKLTNAIDMTVTYHDPCYLGRHSGVYEEPRKLIQKIPGVTFIEMENSRVDSDCCGMGGGRMWMETADGAMSSQELSERRVRQAIDTGAEVLLTACPFCNISLNDAVHAIEKEDTINVFDITELIAMSL